MKLYEKIKYLRAYGQSSMQVGLGTGCVCLLAALAGFAGFALAACRSASSMAHCAQVDATEQRWKKEYDEGINPFAAFQRSPADATADRTAVATANGWLCERAAYDTVATHTAAHQWSRCQPTAAVRPLVRRDRLRTETDRVVRCK